VVLHLPKPESLFKEWLSGFLRYEETLKTLSISWSCDSCQRVGAFYSVLGGGRQTTPSLRVAQRYIVVSNLRRFGLYEPTTAWQWAALPRVPRLFRELGFVPAAEAALPA
jgi:hypothetical protein